MGGSDCSGICRTGTARCIPTNQLFNCGEHGMAFVDPKAGLVMLKDIEKCHTVNGEPV